LKEYFPTLWGNDGLRRQVGESILNGSFSHAYLIQGPSGTGKRHFAHAMAAAICCEEKNSPHLPLPCGECRSCKRLLKGETPDLMTLDREDKASLGIDHVRRMKEDIYLSPTELDRKIYIINEADKMTVNAQNALLIMLEEPPTDVAIFLLCEDAFSMLTTVRSRVRTLRMSSFSQEQLAAFAVANNASARRMKENEPEKFADLIAASEGSPGRALALFGSREGTSLLAQRKDIFELVSCLNSRTAFSRLQAAVALLPQTKRNDFAEALRLFSVALRDLILLKRDENAPLCFYGSREDAIAQSESIGLRTLFAASDAIGEALADLARNANVSVVSASLTNALYCAHTK